MESRADRDARKPLSRPVRAEPREAVARFARRVESQLRDLRRKERLRSPARKGPKGGAAG